MSRKLYALIGVFAISNLASASGLLIPVEPDVPPLALLKHQVDVRLEDQVAVTKVTQTFRNHTEHALEANYVFPVPAGASVRQFSMWVAGKRVKGELLKADRAKDLYTSIVRKTKNPALLDYIGADLLSMKIYPIPPKSDHKVEVSFTAIARHDHGVVQYVYPLETDRQSTSTLEDFNLQVTLKSQRPLSNIYSPTHAVTIDKANDHLATIKFSETEFQLNRDFRLFYTTSEQDIGLTSLQHRPISDEDGYAMLLISPRAELSKEQEVPRDIVFVVDTSGSMANEKMDQAKAALKQCLGDLSADDRFGVVSFATTVNRYRGGLAPATTERVDDARKWVGNLYAGGGTAIHEALMSALEMRSAETGRMFTLVFFTDGKPTIGETKVDKILADTLAKNTTSTRIFSFGIGHNLNAAFLDQLAEQTRALSSYVRPDDNLETKVSSFFNKIRHPVLANLKLTATGDASLSEVYPPQLPDLFHGDQLVVLARVEGAGQASLKLNGQIDEHEKEFNYDLEFRPKSDGKEFVEELWARRKVGYLLDQIRLNGEQKELVDAVVELATHYGITTPYTSYLIMPDAEVQLANVERAATQRGASLADAPRFLYDAPQALYGGRGGAGKRDTTRLKVVDFAKQAQPKSGDLANNRSFYQDESFGRLEESLKKRTSDLGQAAVEKESRLRKTLSRSKELKGALETAQTNYRLGRWRENQVDKLGVDLAVSTRALKGETQLKPNAVRRVANRSCLEFGGVWIDEKFTASMKTCSVKAQSDAYFQILERQPQMKDVFKLGNHLVWITPNGTGLVIDSEDGKEKMSDGEIDILFARK